MSEETVRVALNHLEILRMHNHGMVDDGMNLFGLAERRLEWIDRRHGLLSQNVANANTPGYVAKDLQPFAQSLVSANRRLALTDPGHMPGSLSASDLIAGRHPAERAPDGNGVSLDDQLTKIADTDGAQALVSNLYRKYLGLFRMVIGK